MEYIKVSKAAEKWGITPRRVRVLCAEGKIDGVYYADERASHKKGLFGRRK